METCLALGLYWHANRSPQSDPDEVCWAASSRASLLPSRINQFRQKYLHHTAAVWVIRPRVGLAPAAGNPFAGYTANGRLRAIGLFAVYVRQSGCGQVAIK